MTIVRELPTITLDKGAHPTPDLGMCVMEAVAYVAGEPHSDHPVCASPVLTGYAVSLNDLLPTSTRQLLVPMVPRIVGTATDGQDEARGYLALDWLIRTYTAAWLDLAGLTAEATALRDLRRIVDRASARTARPVVEDGQAKASAAWAAAWDADRADAWDAAGSAAGHAAGSAAGYASRDAAMAAARAAARDAARDVAWAAAGSASKYAARAAAWDATGSAAGHAARDALKPMVETLQLSAVDLLARMIDPAAVRA
jgi:hypothetical protein